MDSTIFVVDQDYLFHCPYDGARTEAVSDNGVIYKERCLSCSKIFNFEIESED